MYKPLVTEGRCVDVLASHACATKKEIPLCYIDSKGLSYSLLYADVSVANCFLLIRQPRVRFICCECEPAAVTMVRAQLWPDFHNWLLHLIC